MAINTITLEEGPRNLVLLICWDNDTNAETVDPSNHDAEFFKIEKLQYSISQTLGLSFNGTANPVMQLVAGEHTFDFCYFGGVPDPEAGNGILSLTPAAAADGFLIAWLQKR